jgi:hypothetical protein
VTGSDLPAPCRTCRAVTAHAVRGEYRRTGRYTDHRPEDWIEEAWLILECHGCREVRFAARWFGSAEQARNGGPVFYDWTGYVPGGSWHQLGDEISE